MYQIVLIAIALVAPTPVAAQSHQHMVNPATGCVTVMVNHGMHSFLVTTGCDEEGSSAGSPSSFENTPTTKPPVDGMQEILVAPGYWATTTEEVCKDVKVSTTEETFEYLRRVNDLRKEEMDRLDRFLESDESKEIREQAKKELGYPKYEEQCEDTEKRYWVPPVTKTVAAPETKTPVVTPPVSSTVQKGLPTESDISPEIPATTVEPSDSNEKEFDSKDELAPATTPIGEATSSSDAQDEVKEEEVLEKKQSGFFAAAQSVFGSMFNAILWWR